VTHSKLEVAPKAVEAEGRICFGISFFATEEDAETYAAIVHERGDTYNGGFFHGMACGRASRFDRVREDGTKLYAVTD